MPHKTSPGLAGIPHHVIQRANARSPCFFADDDFLFFLDCLKEGAVRYRCAVHAYVVMTDHVHLLVSPDTEDGLSLMMRYLGSRYVQYVNYIYQHTGTLWEGRFKSSLIDSERYLLACYRYIESNPVRARMVASPAEYRWSSYGYHAQGCENTLIRDHRLYLELGATQRERQLGYRDLFRHELDDRVLDEIRTSVNKGLVLGGEQLKDEMERMRARRERPERPVSAATAL